LSAGADIEQPVDLNDYSGEDARVSYRELADTSGRWSGRPEQESAGSPSPGPIKNQASRSNAARRNVTGKSSVDMARSIRVRWLRRFGRVACAPIVERQTTVRVGYDSPSQFSREYSRYFGMPPGKDMARLRTVSALDGRFA
jgi:hypothetical protein